MRKKFSSENKKRNLLIAIVICLIVLAVTVFLAAKYTPFLGKFSMGGANDSIGINAMCTNVRLLSDDEIEKILEDKTFDGFRLDDRQLKKIKNANSELCVADMVYKIYNNTAEIIDTVNITVEVPKSSSMSAYFSTPLKIVGEEAENETTAYQKAIISSDSVDKKYIDMNLNEPEDFYANLKYRLEYKFKGSDEKKEMTYVTVSKKKN